MSRFGGFKIFNKWGSIKSPSAGAAIKPSGDKSIDYKLTQGIWPLQATTEFGVVTTPSIYDFTSHTFTNCGTTGYAGPTLAACISAYSGTTWAANTEYFTVQGPSNGIQKWLIPETATYTIEVAGARGWSGRTGYGNGAILRGNIELIAGDYLLIAVGQEGVGAYAGGGGTFVGTGTIYSSATPVIVAGGGSGGYSSASTENHGRTTIKGGICSAVPANAPGDNGHAGADSLSGSTSYDPGAGWIDGGRQYDGTYNKGFLEGAAGGNAASCGTGPGGFGGGGGSCPAAGGGYSGGAAGGSSHGGGGGGSYFDTAFTDRSTSDGKYELSTSGIVSTLGYNAAAGYCTITKL